MDLPYKLGNALNYQVYIWSGDSEEGCYHKSRLKGFKTYKAPYLSHRRKLPWTSSLDTPFSLLTDAGWPSKALLHLWGPHNANISLSFTINQKPLQVPSATWRPRPRLPPWTTATADIGPESSKVLSPDKKWYTSEKSIISTHSGCFYWLLWFF